jgi:conjugal transfer/entry exclusion protein
MVDDTIVKDENEVEQILQQLDNSLEKLETVVEGHLESKIANQDYAAEVQRMGADRSRLAGSLDDAEVRCQRLENVNREVSSRLVNAMETIRGVIDKSPRT